MSYPHWWNETVTLYRKNQSRGQDGKTVTSWVREVLNGCFFGVTERQVFSGTAIVIQDSFIVRIPASYDIFHKGDIVIKGETAAEAPDKNAPNAFVINTVKDNSKMRNAHYFGGEA